MAQRLSTAQSAYLRQHAENPVDWWPWGKEAFAEAARRDLPVFVSIGYAACHWCHVMAHESFEDQDTADLLNERFVSIKVDREEHPDVDDAYMAATQAMTGQGGWPMSVFALPDGRVFHAGTYFPPQRMGQVPSFTEVLHAVHQAWSQRREQVEEQAAKLAEALGRQRRRQSELATVVQTEHDGAPEPTLRPEDLTELTDQVLAALAAEEDVVHGGFGSAPKFPPSPMLSWLVEESAWRLRSGQSAADDRAGGLAGHTMEAMARSALFDQVEGGFARYTVDRAWQLPHFEKMLYDNGQLLGAYARLSVHPAAGKQTQQRAARTARMTIDWLESRMLTEQGLLASSLDADTVQEDGARAEGATYLFSDDQLIQAARESGLSDSQAQRLAELNHGVPADEHTLRSGGPMNVSGNTPRTLHFDDPLSDDDLGLWEEVLPRLRQMRSARPQPNRDDKVVAAWNAQAVRSLAEVAALWDDPQLLEFAQGVAQRLWEVHAELHHMDPPREADGRTGERPLEHGSVQAKEGFSTKIRRTSYAGRPGSGLGTLADHAQVVSMCCAIASAGADAGIWLDRAASVLRFLLREFIVAEAGSITVLESLDADGLLSQAQDGAADASPVDGPEPSSIALLAQAVQQAEALGLMLDLPWVKPTTHPGSRAGVPLRPADLLQHLGLIGPRAPLAVGGSLLAARRAAQGSPALRVFSGSAEDIAEVRRMGTLWGIPVEPTDGVVVGAEKQLRVSICLNDQASGVCLAPADTVDGAVQQL